jgi:hypothetical protein
LNCSFNYDTNETDAKPTTTETRENRRFTTIKKKVNMANRWHDGGVKSGGGSRVLSSSETADAKGFVQTERKQDRIMSIDAKQVANIKKWTEKAATRIIECARDGRSDFQTYEQRAARMVEFVLMRSGRALENKTPAERVEWFEAIESAARKLKNRDELWK